ncbi:Spy/CpxP family protein refolding chaperone [Aquabacterium sp.]|uniref:Spy/CpxP family protein refolding chaperone n=1 Tax=Aquabacterium sp. TaxID=1872578 RepID=UPI00198A0954|nr:Spy/CpxP family protein refolding chaperone [Aquabacterium sp.]MBC7702134.1 Spy/CpxP family protein refolding chaperone [Aquabacterium sp.]
MGKIAKLTHADMWRPLAMASALLVISAVSAFSMSSLAQAQEPGAVSSVSAPSGEPPHHHGRMMHGPGPGGPDMMPLGGRRLDRVLDQVKATDAQRTQIKVLAKSAEADLKPLHEAGRGVHEQTLALFAQPQLDAAAAEKLRQQGLANHDALSKRMLQFALDAGKVLTPAQRAELVAKAEKHHDQVKSRGQAHARLEH